MTHYYYDSKANKFYGPLDRMPPAPIGYDLKPEHEFDDYLKSITSHPHTFTGHSRVVPEGEIEWRYEFRKGDSSAIAQGWIETRKDFYDMCRESHRRRVATPKITAQPDKPGDEIAKLKEYADKLWDMPTIHDPGAVINSLLQMIALLPEPPAAQSDQEAAEKGSQQDAWEWVAIFYGALKELCDLKKLKDAEGKTDDYNERQPKAWYLANSSIELWAKSDYGALPIHTSQQPVDAVAFGIWLSKNYIAAVEDGYIGLKDKQHHTTADLYALFTARHPTPKPGSQEGGKHL